MVKDRHTQLASTSRSHGCRRFEEERAPIETVTTTRAVFVDDIAEDYSVFGVVYWEVSDENLESFKMVDNILYDSILRN